MNSELQKEVERLFAAAIEQPQDRRAAFLEERCHGNESLLAEVNSLLEHFDSSKNFLETPAVDWQMGPSFADALFRLDDPIPEERRIGQYKIKEIIGYGGMGNVYLAEQENPQRTVALKVIKSGITSPAAIRRFKHEAQVLGKLQHPGIAQVFEAGLFESKTGLRPFFTMEYVSGLPLTVYAERHELSTKERLRLLARICDAVHHAHQKGVIHRDLKPDNILVDEAGFPKILDFGVARVTDSDIKATTLHTDVGQLIGTIPYMSPEQCDFDSKGLDSRSDVYSLGVLAYELLTGLLPHDLQDKQIPEAVRIIREEDPTPLSSVNKIFRGDLDTIVSKALEKDKDRRYLSARDLALDIERYLNDQPIVARPASAIYQLRKFAKRNKAIVGGTVAVFVVLILGFAGTGIGMVKARREAENAQVTVDYLKKILSSPDPRKKGHDVKMVDVLDWAVEGFDTEFTGRPEIKARIFDTFGMTYHALGRFNKAEPYMREAFALFEELYGEDHAETLEVMDHLLTLVSDQRSIKDAERLARGLLDRCRRNLGENHPNTLKAQNDLGWILGEAFKFDEARALLETTWKACSARFGEDHPDTLEVLNNLAWVLAGRKDFEKAEETFRIVWAKRKDVLGENDPQTLETMNSLAFTLKNAKKLEEAELLFKDVAERRLEMLGREHPDTIFSNIGLAWVYQDLERFDEAEKCLVDNVKILYRSTDEALLYSKLAITILITALTEQEKLVAAEPWARLYHERQHRVYGIDHINTRKSLNRLIGVLKMQGGRKEQIHELVEDFFVQLKEIPDRPDIPMLRLMYHRAQMLRDIGRFDEAEKFYRIVYEKRGRFPDVVMFDKALVGYNLAIMLADRGRFADAEVLFRTLDETLDETVEPDSPEMADYLLKYGKCLTGLNRFAEAETRLKSSLEISRSLFEDDALQIKNTLKALAELYEAWGDEGKAAEYRGRLDEE